MTPRETSADIMARALATFAEAFEALRRETAPPPADDEPMTGPQAAREEGCSTEAVSLWCRQRRIMGAWQNGHRGRWHFTRANWEQFKRGRIGKPRSRSRSLHAA